MTRALLFRCGAVMFGLGAAWLLLEVALRAFGYRLDADRPRATVLRASPDPELGWEMVPGTEGYAWVTEVRIHGEGFRGAPWPPGPKARPRVLALGDSLTLGVFVPETDTWPVRLERELAAAGSPAEVRNLGVTGYDTLQEIRLLESRGLAMDPDAILVGFCLNDVAVAAEYVGPRDLADRLHNSPLAASRALRLGIHAFEAAYAIAGFLADNRPAAFRRSFGDRILPVPGEDRELAERMAAARLRHPVIGGWYQDRDKVGRLAWAFARLGELGRERALPILVAIFPLLEGTRDRYAYRAAHDLVTWLAQREGLGTIDLLPAMAEEGSLEALRVFAIDDLHPSGEGYRRAAAALVEPVRRMLPGGLWSGATTPHPLPGATPVAAP